jgi:hypothetical protein
MLAPLSEPHDGLLLHNSFAGIAQHAPPSEVVTVGLVISLLAVSQLLRPVGPLVCAGEVGHKLFFEIYPTIDTSGWQIV